MSAPVLDKLDLSDRPELCPGCERPLTSVACNQYAGRWSGVCVACERWAQRYPNLTWADRRAQLERTPPPVAQMVDPPQWRRDAACREAPTELFEWREGPSAVSGETYEIARAFCGHCPVRAQCNADADANHDLSWGLFGGVYRGPQRRRRDLLAELDRRDEDRRIMEAARRARHAATQRRRKQRIQNEKTEEVA